ncbi:MAG TPA: hypothetical protein VLM40_19935, partial [Gemmata sp.]|nr:hypothetical protein [Gemmata sp.]
IARKREERARKIEILVQEVREHLKAARDTAQFRRELGQIPALLKRPSQKELAKRCRLTESDVSRCLKDPEAGLLRVLWDAAGDLEQVLAWDGRVGSKPTR